MIKITDNARAALLDRSGAHRFVRIGVQSGGCSGMTYYAEIVEEKQENEKIVWKDAQLSIITDDESLPYLTSLHIDYSQDLVTAGFRFSNGDNKKTCGCGASFSKTGEPLLNDEEAGCGF